MSWILKYKREMGNIKSNMELQALNRIFQFGILICLFSADSDFGYSYLYRHYKVVTSLGWISEAQRQQQLNAAVFT